MTATPDEISPSPELCSLRTQEALAQTALRHLRFATGLLGVGHGILAYGYLRGFPISASSLAPVAMLSALLLVSLHFILGRWPILLRHAHTLSAATVGIVLMNSLLILATTRDPLQTTFLIATVVGSSFLLLSTRWWLSMVTVALVGWLSLAIPHWDRTWAYLGALLTAITAMGGIIHRSRLRRHCLLTRLHLLSESRQREFQRLLQQERQRRLLSERLYEVSRALSQTLDFHEVLNLILENLSQLVPFDRGAVLLRRDNILEIVAAKGFPQESSPLEIKVCIKEDDVFEQIRSTQRPLLIADVLHRPDWQQLDDLPQARAWMGIPLINADGEVTGMLSLARETPTPYTDDEAALALAFAGQAAIALQNANLYSELAFAYAQLERMDRTKSDFITVASHELRTPLTLLKGFSEVLREEPQIQANPLLLRMVEGICNGANRLQEIVERMLDMAEIDSRTMHLHVTPLSLGQLVEVTVDAFRPALRERELTLEVQPMDHLPLIEGDQEALRKVLSHLILNAIKYTPNGGKITVAARHVPAGPHGLPTDGVEITVRDTGIGIDPSYHDAIFLKFYRADEVAFHSSGRTKFKGGGPGLGLAIVRGIVEAHNGRVWVESPGRDEKRCPGSTFHVLLPLRQIGTRPHPSSPQLGEA